MPLKLPSKFVGVRGPGGRESFVLVAVLLLLSLITLLVVGSLLLARVERRAAFNSATGAMAQQNALLALSVALGQLQREAGPDQRVTARADILSTNSFTTNSSITTTLTNTVPQPFWTGVWKTYNPKASDQRLDVGGQIRAWSTASTNVVWLVSGYTNGSTTVTPTAFPGTITNYATVATNAVVSGSTTNYFPVQVPSIAIGGTMANGTTTTLGHYGYWVSDEGIKAKANLVDGSTTYNGLSTVTTTNNISDLMRNYLHFQAPQANATFLGLPSTLGSDNRASTNGWAVTTLPSLIYLPGTTATGFTPNQYSADYTTYSMGVLADVRKGGLKTDLTAPMENAAQFQALFPINNGQANWHRVANVSDTGQVFVSENPSTVSTNNIWIDGVHWETLFHYYNLYKQTMPYNLTNSAPAGTPTGLFSWHWLSSSANPTAYNPTTAKDTIGIQQRIYGCTEGNPATNGASEDWINPVILATKMQVVLGASQVPNGATTNYDLELRYYPEMVVWNPYSSLIYGKYNAGNSFSSYLGMTWNTLIGGTNSVGAQQGMVFYANGIPITNTYLANYPDSPPYISPQPFYTNAFNGQAPVIASDTNSMGVLYPGEVRALTLPNSGGTLFSTTNTCLAGNFTNLGSGAAANSPYNYQYFVVNATMTNSSGVTTNFPGTTVIKMTGPLGTGGAGNALHTTAKSMPQWSGSTITANNESDTYVPTRPSFTGPPAGSSLSSGIAISSLYSQPILLVSQYLRVKGINSESGTSFYNYDSNIPAFLPNADGFNWLAQTDSGYQEELENLTFTNFSSAHQMFNSTNNTPDSAFDTSWGLNPVGQDAFCCQVITRDVPVEPLVSVGQFMHMPYSYYGGNYAHSPAGTMFVGGSTPDPCIPLGLTYNNNASATNYGWPQNDNSYLANQALFDTYYFSTVPTPLTNSGAQVAANQYTAAATGAAGPTLTISPFNGFNQAYVNNNEPLPNGRLRYYTPTSTSPVVADLQDPHKAAANLMVDGAFNVNSTSIAAWTAFLGSLSGNGFLIWDAYFDDQSTSPKRLTSYTSSALNYCIPRFWSTTVSGVNTGESGNSVPGDSPWDGSHPLTQQQITELATEIVRQIKLRGPFLSMADFLNRRLNAPLAAITDPYQTREGALQAAIDAQTGSTYASYSDGINTTAISYGTTVSLASNMTSKFQPAGLNTNNLPEYTAIGIPAYLMQQDIVQDFAPVMTVRSDTFVVRCYGETDNPTSGAVTGQAWGEAVVQRVPDFVDQTDPALSTAPSSGHTLYPPINSSLTNATPIYDSTGAAIVDTTNLTLGRRFKIISFRWLNPNEL